MAIPRSVVSRCATAWAESPEGALNGHQPWAMLCRYRCRLLLAEVPNGSDRNTELKTTTAAVGDGRSSRSLRKKSGTAAHRTSTPCDGLEQVTLSASQSGIRYKRARDVARPANFGAFIAANPRILDMIQGAVTAGLLGRFNCSTDLRPL